jgi:hypothetical protein
MRRTASPRSRRRRGRQLRASFYPFDVNAQGGASHVPVFRRQNRRFRRLSFGADGESSPSMRNIPRQSAPTGAWRRSCRSAGGRVARREDGPPLVPCPAAPTTGRPQHGHGWHTPPRLMRTSRITSPRVGAVNRGRPSSGRLWAGGAPTAVASGTPSAGARPGARCPRPVRRTRRRRYTESRLALVGGVAAILAG